MSTNDERINKTNGYSNFELSPVKRGHKNISQDNVCYDCLCETNEEKHGVNPNIYTNSVPSYSEQNSYEDLSYDLLWQMPTSDQADYTYDHADGANSHKAIGITDDTYNHADGTNGHKASDTTNDIYNNADGTNSHKAPDTIGDTYDHADGADSHDAFATTDDTYNHAGSVTNHGFATTADDYYSHTDCATNN